MGNDADADIKKKEENALTAQGPRATRSMSESYSLNVTHDNVDESVTAVITADNYFGARHALETLFQAVDYDEVGHARHYCSFVCGGGSQFFLFIGSSPPQIRGTYVALVDYYIDDSPEFSHRQASKFFFSNLVFKSSFKKKPKSFFRGVSLDTSRNFMTVDTVKRIIDGLSSSKVREHAKLSHLRTTETSVIADLDGEGEGRRFHGGCYDRLS